MITHRPVFFTAFFVALLSFFPSSSFPFVIHARHCRALLPLHSSPKPVESISLAPLSAPHQAEAELLKLSLEKHLNTSWYPHSVS